MLARLQRAGAYASGFGRLTLGLFPWAPSSGPVSASAITPALLTKALGDSFPGGRIRSFEAVDATSGTTNRHRLRLDWDGHGVGLPETIFLKSTALVGRNRALSAVLRMTANELAFYRHVRDEVPLVAPKAYGMVDGRGGRFLLLLEDLGAGGGVTPRLADELELAHFEALIDALALLHATFWDSPRFGSHLRWVKEQTHRPGYPMLSALFKACRRTVLRSDRPIPERVRRLTRLLSKERWTLARLFEQGPRTFVHGDTHAGNSFARPDGSAGFLDWQVVHQAHGVRDVAYMLGVSMSTELRRSHERSLLSRYVTRLADRGVQDLQETTAWELYRIFAVDAWDAVVTTAAFPGLQPPENVERAFARGVQAVDDLDSLAAVEAALARGSLV
ncbi:MAG TPA: aminoglycoside phosphotransferase family protein [Actinomycetota bacterium]|nr:aminoglycoside phosphotransferase family protein [Actinomycetota bacterium]